MFRVQAPDSGLENETHHYNFDLAVLGAGSGGLACAKEAANLGAKVVLFDYVTPSPQKTTWGIGGTCLNVGCIPKKLMHTASLYGELIDDAKKFGWEASKTPHDWGSMVDNIQNHIKSQNWGIKADLVQSYATLTYYNEHATFIDNHTVKSVSKRGKERTVTADKFILAMGGRPNYPDIPGAKEWAITSDDIFSLKYPPGRTLCVGASYISLECAGFLHGMGVETSVLVRSILLRGFDRECAEKIGGYMEASGIRFIRPGVPTKIECLKEHTTDSPPELKVYYSLDGEEKSEIFNTVLFAIGRKPLTKTINPDAIGLKYDPNGKIPVNEAELTNLPNIYAVGDLLNAPELTPLAVQSGRLLARRLFGGSKILTDYVNVPTTVFTPLEYGSCGLSEEAAIAKYGEESVEVYHSKYTPTELVVLEPKPTDGHHYAKLICNTADSDRVVGLHYLGPSAGEVVGGFGMALTLGATKSDFDRLVGIHPTSGEVFTTLSVTKRSGASIEVEDC